MKCDCISSNQPEKGGTELEVILEFPDFFKSERKTVCVDSCMVSLIKELWKEKIYTLSSCCGHNGLFDIGRFIVVHQEQAKEAKIIAGDDTKILYWKLTELESHEL